MSYLLDTCVFSEVSKKKPELSVITWLDRVSEDECFISVLTLGELYKGVSKLLESYRKQELRRWLELDFRQRFAGRVLDITEAVSVKWAQILGERERQGLKLPMIDSLIGATAIVHDLIVVTRNVRDIKPSGASTFNPWLEQ